MKTFWNKRRRVGAKRSRWGVSPSGFDAQKVVSRSKKHFTGALLRNPFFISILIPMVVSQPLSTLWRQTASLRFVLHPSRPNTPRPVAKKAARQIPRLVRHPFELRIHSKGGHSPFKMKCPLYPQKRTSPRSQPGRILVNWIVTNKPPLKGQTVIYCSVDPRRLSNVQSRRVSERRFRGNSD